jgi:Ca2+-binding RTX toxin-like protein
MAYGNDKDFYQVTVDAKGMLAVEFDVPTNSTTSSFDFTLYDTDGSKALYSYSTGQDKTYTMGLPKAGTYFIGIESYYSSTYFDAPYSLKPTFTAGGIPGLELESNDTPADADVLPSDIPIKGQISRGSDVDLFKVTAAGPGLLTVNFDSPLSAGTSEAYELVVLDGAGKKLFSQFTGGDLTYEVGLPAAGNYYVGVQAGDWYYTSQTYAIKGAVVASTGQRFEAEPNDKTPNVLLADTKMIGQLGSASDIDLFQFSLASPSQLKLAFDFTGADATQDRFTIGIFDSSGNLLVNRSVPGDVELQAAAASSGAYFVAVTGAGSSYASNQYSLLLTATKAIEGVESEPNNQAAEADKVTLGQSMTGQLSTPQDKDWYSLDLNSKGRVSVSLDVPTNSSWARYYRLEVQDPTGKTLAVRDVGADTNAEFDVGAYGAYRVAISSPYGSHDDGPYKLLVTANLEDAVPAGAITGTSLGERLAGTAADDLIYGLGGNDLIDGGAGTDTVVFRASSPNLSINTIGGLTAVRGNFAAGDHAYSVSRLWNVEKIKTWSGTESLVSQAVTPLLGTAQADRLVGTAGNDLIDGLGGSDFIDGGAGTDTLALFGSRDAFSIATIVGITRIRGGDSTGEYAGHVIKLVNVESLGFVQGQTRTLQTADANRLFGSAAADLLRGTTGDDVIDGQGGADTVDGGAGQDTLVFFGRYSDFSIAYPTAQVPELRVTGKAGTEFAGQVTRIANVETLAFTDTSIPVENPPRMVAAAEANTVAEGGPGATLTLALTVKPESPVTVTIATGTQLTASLKQLSFDASNWNVVQRVTVTAVDDTVLEKRHTGQLTLTTASTDPRYQGQAETIAYGISDNELSNLGSVAGQLWNDLDQDGTVDAGEGPLVGWQVFDDVNRNGKRDTGEVTVITDNSGRYLLDDLSPGAHTIVAMAASGWAPTYPTKANWSASLVVNEADSGESGTGEWSTQAVTSVQAAAIHGNLGEATKLSAFRADPRFADIQGQGLAVVVIDTGIDLDHPAFGPDSDRNGVADRIVYQYDFVGFNDSNASDGQGHGTHVAGIVGSSDPSYPGVAPKVNLIVLRVLDDRGRGGSFDIQEAMNWVVANAAKYNVVAVNLSLGDNAFDRYPASGYLSSQIKALANSGVVVVSASGNSYDELPVQGVNYPSSDPYSLSVGAVWPAAGSVPNAQVGVTDAIAFFSQRDDTESDIFAPGVNINSARNGGGYVLDSGTSMASPEIAGMVALAQQLAMASLGRRLTFDEVRSLLKSTGSPIFDGDDENDTVPNTGLTFKRVDMLAFAEAIIQLPPLISHSVTVVANQRVTGRDFGFSSTAVVQGLSADDLIVGSLGGEVIRGGAGADDIDGGAGDDLIYGEAGNDRLRPGVGNDTVDGGDGIDTAVFAGARAGYTLSFDAALQTYTVKSSAEGEDLLKNIERLEFSDLTISAAAVSDTVPPVAKSFSPADGARAVAVASDVTLRFSEPVQLGSGTITLKAVSDSQSRVVETFSASVGSLSLQGDTIVLNPTRDLDLYTNYLVEFGVGAVTDMAGNPFASAQPYDFRTASLDGLYQFFAVAFAAAPGVTYLGQLAEAYNYFNSLPPRASDGAEALQQIVEIFTTKTQFTSVYPESLSNRELAQTLVSQIVKNSASEASRQVATKQVEEALGIWTRGKTIFTVFGNLANKPLTDPEWGGTAKQFQNQLAVARYFTEEMGVDTTDLSRLRGVLQSITPDTDVSTVEKIVQIIGSQPPGG